MTSTDTRRVAGWERVLDAFMADPDRILTNVQLGHLPGVQAFHQRMTDLTHYGYVLTSAVQLKPGRYAYALLGVTPHNASWPFTRPRPHADRLAVVADEHDAYAATVAAAVAKIEAKTDALLARDRTPAEPTRSDGDRTRAMRDAAACLVVALGDDIVGDWAPADRGDVLALARAARDEIGRTRSLRAVEQANTAQALEIAEAIAELQDLLGDHIADWTAADRGALLALVRKTCVLHEEGREVIAELDRRLQAAPSLVEMQAVGEEAEGAMADRNLSRSELDDIAEVLGLDADASGRHGAVLARVRELASRPTGRVTGPFLIRRALEYTEQPMHFERIAAWVMENGGAAIYTGDTPVRSIRDALIKSHGQGGEFVRVARACFGLREWATGGADDGPQLDDFGNELLELEPIR